MTTYFPKYRNLTGAVLIFVENAGMSADRNFVQVTKKAIQRQLDGDMPKVEAQILADWDPNPWAPITEFGVRQMLTEAIAAAAAKELEQRPMTKRELFAASEAISRGEPCPACGATWEHRELHHRRECAYVIGADEYDKREA